MVHCIRIPTPQPDWPEPSPVPCSWLHRPNHFPTTASRPVCDEFLDCYRMVGKQEVGQFSITVVKRGSRKVGRSPLRPRLPVSENPTYHSQLAMRLQHARTRVVIGFAHRGARYQLFCEA